VSLLEYEVKTAKDAGFLRITVSGAFALQPSKDLLDRLAADARHHEADRVLLDFRGVVGRATTLDRYELGAHAAAHVKVKIAFVGLPEMIDRLPETVAVNRGAKVRVFTDEAEALSWLLSERGPLEPQPMPYVRG
jgi:hypothetical protein